MKIKILGHEYDLIYDPNWMKQENLQGSFRANALKIIIDSSLPPSTQKEILLHESIEAINYHLELKLEHHQISALSEVLFQIIRDNKLKFDE